MYGETEGDFMRIIMSTAALALLFPALAAAQVAGNNQPISVEIVASGELDVPATKLSMTFSFIETGSSQAAADKARDAKMLRIEQVLKAQGFRPARSRRFRRASAPRFG